jgi:hypothetical protein
LKEFVELNYSNYIEPNTNNQINFYIKNVIKNNDVEGICRIKL